MIALLQRVSKASVTVNNEIVGQINTGLLILIGIENDDNEQKADRLIERFLGYRIFADSEDKMNLSVTDVAGSILLVPQFTLAADTNKGMRPSFSSAAAPQEGKRLFEYVTDRTKQLYPAVSTGQFAADMKVSLVNDGPVTFWLQT